MLNIYNIININDIVTRIKKECIYLKKCIYDNEYSKYIDISKYRDIQYSLKNNTGFVLPFMIGLITPTIYYYTKHKLKDNYVVNSKVFQLSPTEHEILLKYNIEYNDCKD
jgi:hypothetical protein